MTENDRPSEATNTGDTQITETYDDHTRISDRVAVDHFAAPNESHNNELKRTRSEKSAASQDVDTAAAGGFNYERVLKEHLSLRQENEIQSRQLGVVFKDLTVSTTDSSANFHTTMGSPFSPSTLLRDISAYRNPQKKNILQGAKGVVKPGEMLLVLGSPGAGCTTFLKVLANQTADYKDISGDISYDGISPKVLAESYKGDATYCPEEDIHFPTLTVEQTLNFAASVRTPHSRVPNESRDDFVNFMVNTLVTLFGLDHARHTVIGNAAIRGISGGEKRRVSLAEQLALRGCLGSWDKYGNFLFQSRKDILPTLLNDGFPSATRGLDASTALEFAQALRIATDVGGLTSISALYQASENIYNLFDKVCVLNQGRMVYFGPVSKARQYFIDLGFEPANRQTTPDFLVAVTGAHTRIFRKGFEKQAPKSPSEMAAAFESSNLSAQLDKEITEYQRDLCNVKEKTDAYRQSALAEKAKRMPRSSPYTISIWMQIREVMKRRVQVIRGDATTQGIVLGSFVFQALITGSVFFNLKVSTDAFFSRGGVIFFSILFPTLSALSEIPALYSQRPIVARHGRAAMYHPFVEAAALTLVDAILFVIVILAFAIILYFMANLQRSAGQFFIYALFIYSATIAMKSYFRSLAAMFGSEPPATAVAGVSTMITVLYAGYVIPKPSMIGGLKWLSYLDPLGFAFEAVISNEFHTVRGQCAGLVPQGPGYENVTLSNQACSTVGSIPGQRLVSGERFLNMNYGYYYSHLWRNFGIVCAFAVGFTAWLLISTEIRSGLTYSTEKLLFLDRGRKSQSRIPNSSVTNDEEKGISEAPRSASSTVNEENRQSQVIKTVSTERPVFTFKNINYTISSKTGKRKLLEDVCGYVIPGKMTALMGESGAGKTTLLNALADRVSTGVVTGNRYVNGGPLPSDFQAQTGYCQQMDTHIEFSTVKEAVYFSAKLRQPSSVTLSEKKKYAMEVLKRCALEHYADAIVGTLGVEHKKRLTIAVELAAKPALLLFLDEPTSGLDAQSAAAIVQFMRQLAQEGQAILCTIHQPSAELFQEFDMLLLLKKGGQTAYFGELGLHSKVLIEYFERNKGRPCGTHENPAEWMLDVIGAGTSATNSIDWYDVWQNSPERATLDSTIEDIHQSGSFSSTCATSRSGQFAAPWFAQFTALLNRNFKFYWRDLPYLMSKLSINITCGLLIGFTFFQSDFSMQGVQNKIFSLFMGLILSVPMAQSLMVPFCRFRDVYEIREGPSKTYSWTSMLAASLVVEIPFNILSSSLFFICYYWTVGFENDRAGFIYLFMGVCFPLYYTTVGQASASLAPDPIIGALLFSVLFSLVFIFNGVMQPFRLLGWWKWMYRVSPFTYTVEAVISKGVAQYPIECSPREFIAIQPPAGMTCSEYLDPFSAVAGGYLRNPDAMQDCSYCSSSRTSQFLESSFNISYDRRWRDFGIFVAYIFINIMFTVMFTWMRQGGLSKTFRRLRK